VLRQIIEKSRWILWIVANQLGILAVLRGGSREAKGKTKVGPER
jgi:cell division inhibitor SulA